MKSIEAKMFKGQKISPVYSLAVAVLIAVAMSSMVLHFTQDRAWLGLKLAFDKVAGGAVVKSSQGPATGIPTGTVLTKIFSKEDTMNFTELDFVAEPDGGMGTYKTYYEFLSRQDRFARIQGSEEIVFLDAKGTEWKVQPLKERPLLSLPGDFWIPFIVGLLAWLLCASAWALRPRVDGTRYLLLNGFGMLVSAQFAAVYTTRELAIPAKLFWWIDGLNFLGGSIFAASLVALLLYYPRRLAPRWVGWVVIAIYIVWHILQDNDVVESMTDARRILVMIAIVTTFVLAGVHWAKTRKDPVARAALQWFLLSWILAAGIFSSLLFIPQLAGIDTSAMQGYLFLLFLLMYVGLGLGILRFRLFGLGEWWYRIVFWILAMFLLVALDLIFLFGLNWSSQVSLSAALLICGLFWLPLRGFLQSWLMPRPRPWTSTFKRVVDIALAPPGQHQTELYIRLLKDYFNPLNIQELKSEPLEIELLEHGLALVLPPVVGLPAFRLEYAHGGQKLFSPKDVSSLKELAEMLQYTVDSQNSYKQGVTEERQRMAQDLHDDLGAKLLSGLHIADKNTRPAFEAAIDEMRSIVSEMSAERVPLSRLLADIRHETSKRASATKIKLDWPLSENDKIEHILDYPLQKVVKSAVRETVSNVFRHSQATELKIKIQSDADSLRLFIQDNGRGFSSSVLNGETQGQGIASVKRRVLSLGGTIHFDSENGCSISILIPFKNRNPLPLNRG